jgi:hypothetical protein
MIRLSEALAIAPMKSNRTMPKKPLLIAETSIIQVEVDEDDDEEDGPPGVEAAAAAAAAADDSNDKRTCRILRREIQPESQQLETT